MFSGSDMGYMDHLLAMEEISRASGSIALREEKSALDIFDGEGNIGTSLLVFLGFVNLTIYLSLFLPKF